MIHDPYFLIYFHHGRTNLSTICRYWGYAEGPCNHGRTSWELLCSEQDAWHCQGLGIQWLHDIVLNSSSTVLVLYWSMKSWLITDRNNIMLYIITILNFNIHYSSSCIYTGFLILYESLYWTNAAYEAWPVAWCQGAGHCLVQSSVDLHIGWSDIWECYWYVSIVNFHSNINKYS